jgi:predicted dehydrogenase
VILVKDPNNIKLAMLGMVDGNGHPYSWSAIFNGYDPQAMKKCPFPVIPAYLGKQPKKNFGIPGARVTHIWTDEPGDARLVAKAALIPHVVRKATDVIGQVDAVVIPTDKGWEHVERAKPFIEAGLPVFIDKPLTDNPRDLRQFIQWMSAGKKIMSSSSMRYTREFASFHGNRYGKIGEPRFITITSPKLWERYGIHALEAIYPILGPGFISVVNSGNRDHNIVHLQHRSGAEVVIAVISDMYGSFGKLQIAGTKGAAFLEFKDTFYAFKAQMAAFIGYLQTGQRPFPFSETVELMRIIIAGIKSRENSGHRILLKNL